MLEGKKVLVTGGTGFIGSRLVEKLCLEHRTKVRALVRNFSTASRIARFPVEMIPGDVTDANAVKRATQGCDFVFHCAYDFAGDGRHRRVVSVKGSENVADAVLHAGVTRVVHVSTVSVYGTPDGDLDETSARTKTGDLYADTKLDAENLMFRYHREKNLPVVIVQPTIVYGPFSRSWTIGIVDQLRKGPLALPEDGGGHCNAVYIDDVVDGMILAAAKDEAIGQSFLLSADEPVTWREFFGAYERILGTQSVVYLPVDEPAAAPGKPRSSWTSSPTWRRWREVLSLPEVRVAMVETPVVNWPYRLAKRLAPDLWTRTRGRYLDPPGITTAPTAAARPGRAATPTQRPNPARLALYRANTRVRIEKARRVLGYKPIFDLETGMALTAQFVDWYYSS